MGTGGSSSNPGFRSHAYRLYSQRLHVALWSMYIYTHTHICTDICIYTHTHIHTPKSYDIVNHLRPMHILHSRQVSFGTVDCRSFLGLLWFFSSGLGATTRHGAALCVLRVQTEKGLQSSCAFRIKASDEGSTSSIHVAVATRPCVSCLINVSVPSPFVCQSCNRGKPFPEVPGDTRAA